MRPPDQAGDRIGIVAGSGIELRPLLDELNREEPFPGSGGGIPGHPGRFLHGFCEGRPIVLQCGRLHAYEGFAFEEAVRTVDVLHGFGVRAIIFTNAAGGLRTGMRPGDLMAARRVLSWPYPRYALPDTITPDWVVPGCDHHGAYIWMHGPCYETHAEIATLRRMGADAVGMSTAPELMRCQSLGIAAAAVSCITNACAVQERLTHAHVIEVAAQASGRLCELIRHTLRMLPGQRSG